MLPAHPLDGLLSAFSQNQALFALGTPDGRVRTYDTVTGRLRSSLSSAVGALAGKNNTAVPNGQLAEGHKCITWVDSQRSDKGGQPRSWVALGTSSGAVKLYDSATGEVQWQATNCSEGGVDCLAYTPSRSSTLLCSGRDGQMCILETATGKQQGKFRGSKHAVTAAAVAADGSKLILGGSSLSLFDMDKQQRISKFTGHPLPVCALAFAPSGGFALSAAEGERLVAVWATPNKQSSKKKSGAVAAASLAVEQPVVGLATADAASEGQGCFYAAAVTNAGEAYVWFIRPQGGTAVASQQVAHICVGSKESRSKQDCILAAALEPKIEGVTLLLVAGSPAKPRFERLPIKSDGSSRSKMTFLQPAAADGLIRSGVAATANSPAAAAAATQQPGSRDVEMLGADNGGEAVQQRASSNSSRKRQEPEPDAAADDDAAAAVLQEDDDDDADMDSAEPTLGQRVANLEHQQQQPAIAASAQQQQQPAAAAALPPGPVKADSLSVLLTQALRSSDRALLEQCLSVANDRVIANSVKRLVPVDATALLRAAVERLQSKPARGQQMAAWIHAVLLHHTAYLMAAPGATDALSSLYQIIEGRLAMQRQLLSLAGRLELLLAQSGGQQADAAEAEAAGAAGPQVVYQESDSEAEVEVVDAAADYDESDDEGYYTDEEGEDDDEGFEEGGSGEEDDDE